MKTIPDDSIGQEKTGYVILALASENARRKITELTNELSKELPGILWLTPPEQLHFTLVEIIQPNRHYELGKDYSFNLHRQDYQDTAARVLADVPSFTINFDTIEASQNAIIVRASDSSQLNYIRAKLMSSISLPTETREPPDVTHSSIARYVESVELKRVQEIVAKHRIDFEERITEFRLLKTLAPPLGRYEVLNTFRLA